MRFLVDESTGFAVANQIWLLGHDVEIVAEIMPEADDKDILTHAYTENRVIITNDKDFGELVFRSNHPHHGIILLHLQDERRDSRLRVINLLISQHEKKLPDRFTVATENHIRFRPKI